MKRYLKQHARELTRATIFDLAVFALMFVAGYKAHGQAYWLVPAPRPVYVAPVVAVPVQPLPPGSVVVYPARRPVADLIHGYHPILVMPPQQPMQQPQQQGGQQ